MTESAIAVDAGFWPAVAASVRALAVRTSAAAVNPRDLRGLDVIVPHWAHASILRTALHADFRSDGNAAFVPPRIQTLAAWAGGAWNGGGSLARRVELFDALRGNAWIRSAFGEQAAALWALARHIGAVGDELTFAAIDGAEALEAQVRAILARHFHRRAARAVEPAAQLVLQLWRAAGRSAEGDPASACLAALRTRIAVADRPLLLVAERVEPWLRAGLISLAARVPVQLLHADFAAAIAAKPLLAAAWPELRGAALTETPIAARARAVPAHAAETAPLLVEARSLEEEALAVAQHVESWLRTRGRDDGGSIALVALDRACARRVRALLERAQIQVRDETGWKLSTTSAAGAVMRLFDLTGNHCYYRDLLDWLKSPFSLHGELHKAHGVEAIEKAIRRQCVVQGLGAIFSALAEATGGPATAAATHWLRLLEEHTRRLRGDAIPVSSLARALDRAMVDLGMRAGLAADPVGRAVLQELDALRAQLGSSRTRVSAAEFRGLLAERFEEVTIAPQPVDSPVVMVSLAAAALRDFDAAVLIGADAEHLPTHSADLLFFSAAVRADLGLRGPREFAREQGEALAALLVRVPQVMATWRSRDADEPRALAPWLARLRAVAVALGRDPLRAAEAAAWPVAPVPVPRPGPSAPARLPPRISASQYQSLVNCAYQFYARCLLGLRPLDEVTEDPDQRDYGEAVHAVLARFHREWGDAALHEQPRPRLEESLVAHTAAVFDAKVDKLPRFLALRQQFAETQCAYLDWAQQRAAEGWRFVAAEAAQNVTFEYTVGGGTREIELVGRIDRVDARGEEMELLDYKTRRRSQLAEGLKRAGEDVQLPFYGLLLAPQASSAAYLAIQPPKLRSRDRESGVDIVRPSQDFAELVAGVQGRLRNDLQRVAAGASLTALGVESTCRYCEMRGLCRRDYWKEEAG